MAEAVKKRDYYEVLSVQKNATDAELKTAYRKMALEWHPDKNINRSELAAENFKEIRHAYSILSDPNERAWYDNHKDAILKGKSGHRASDDGEEQGDHGVDLWPFFDPSCYSGMNDTEEGFYNTYQNLFRSIEEEERAEQDEDFDGELPAWKEAPQFGNSKSEWNDVNRFYSHWSNFTSRRRFGWAEKYNPNDAPNRQVRRLIEKDNKKSRDKARKERNDQVRHLVEFIKKRDKRVKDHTLEVKKQQEIKAAEQKERDIKAKKERDEHRAKLFAQRDEEMEELDRELEALHTEEVVQEAEQHLMCMACGKRFKSEKQWQNHEKSRTHRDRIARLQEDLLLDEERAQLDKESGGEDEIGDEEVEVEEGETKEVDLEVDEVADDIEDENEEDEEEEVVKKKLTSKEKKLMKKNQKKMKILEDSDDEELRTSFVEEDKDSEDEEPGAKKKPSAKEKKLQRKNQKKKQILEDSDDDEIKEPVPEKVETEEKEVKKKISAKEKKLQRKNLKKSKTGEDDSDDELPQKKGAKVAKNEKKEGIEEVKEEDTKEKAKVADDDGSTLAQTFKTTKPPVKETRKDKKKGKKKKGDEGFSCAVCNEEFDTRNQLFKHVNDKGHAIPLK